MAKKKKSQNRINYKVWALIIFSAAFLIRLFYLLEIKSTPLFSYLTMDPLFYHQMGLKFAAGEILSNAPFYKAPLYPIFLGLIYSIFGESLFVPRFIQIILGSISCVFIYLLASRFYSNKISVTAGIVAAFFGSLIYFDAELLIPALIVALNLGSILLLFKYEDNGKTTVLLLSAILLGLSGIARPNILIFLPGVIFWLWRLSKWSRRWKKSISIYLVGVVIMILPVTICNYIAGGELIFFGHYSGLNFAIGNNDVSDGRTAVLPGTSPEFWQGYNDAVDIAERIEGRGLTPSEVSNFWFKQGLNYIVGQPIDWLRLELRKLSYLVGGYEISNNKHIYFFAQRSTALKTLLWDKLISFPFGLVLPFALLGLIIVKGRKGNQFLLYFFVISYAVSILLFFITGRYRVPLLPIVIIWAAAGFWELVQLYRRSDYRKFYRRVLLLIIGLVICNGVSYLPGLSPRLLTDYNGHLYTGGVYYRVGDYEKAEKEFHTAARLNAKSAWAFTWLGSACHRQQKDSLAVKYLLRAIRIDEHNERAKKMLANVYKENNQIRELWDLIELEMEENPNSNWVLNYYAYVHRLLDEPGEAADLYEQAFAADTTDYNALFQKAECYLQGDMRYNAEQEYLRIMRLLPNSVEVHANLGQVYARQQRYEEAIKQYKWVIEQEPEQPAGYYNLATVYYQMRELDKAKAMLDRATELGSPSRLVDGLRNKIDQLDEAKPEQ